MMHQHRNDILRLHKAGIEQGKTGKGHEQHQRGGRHYPGGVAGVETVRGKGGKRAKRHKARRRGEARRETIKHV